MVLFEKRRVEAEEAAAKLAKADFPESVRQKEMTIARAKMEMHSDE
jgi:hypothetical protein